MACAICTAGVWEAAPESVKARYAKTERPPEQVAVLFSAARIHPWSVAVIFCAGTSSLRRRRCVPPGRWRKHSFFGHAHAAVHVPRSVRPRSSRFSRDVRRSISCAANARFVAPVPRRVAMARFKTASCNYGPGRSRRRLAANAWHDAASNAAFVATDAVLARFDSAPVSVLRRSPRSTATPARAAAPAWRRAR